MVAPEVLLNEPVHYRLLGGAALGQLLGVSLGAGVGGHASAVTPHEVDSQPESENVLLSVAVTPHQPRSWSKAEAVRNMPDILTTTPVSQSPIGLRGRFLHAAARIRLAG